MKSAVFYGKHDLRIENHEIPAIGPEDVLIQVKACGVCGTDVHIFEGDKGAADVTPPTILGHEFSGVVVQTGSAVTACKAGDRVCVDPNRPCGCCTACRSGINHFCTHMTGYGTTVDGGFAEYCAVDQRQVYLLGQNTSFAQGDKLGYHIHDVGSIHNLIYRCLVYHIVFSRCCKINHK